MLKFCLTYMFSRERHLEGIQTIKLQYKNDQERRSFGHKLTNHTSRCWNYNTTLPLTPTIRTHSFDIYNLSAEINTETKTQLRNANILERKGFRLQRTEFYCHKWLKAQRLNSVENKPGSFIHERYQTLEFHLMPQRTKNMYSEGLLHLSTGILEKTKDKPEILQLKAGKASNLDFFFS